ncbi:FAD:protein FMN transferase [Rhodobacteraceae bacterium M382]|nr:FAD:protein FMN transferase [Rhodobacteraceae bacterium M382]
MSSLSRRRFLTIAAAGAAIPTGALANVTVRWRGVALGAQTSMQIAGVSERQAAPVFAAVEQELNRLETIFSLYRTDSELSRLNRDGSLSAPSAELLNVLSVCSTLHRDSGGVFDPSVQPLWAAMARGETGQALDQARAAVGFDAVRFDTTIVRFVGDTPGQALTLNGIAQGAITDRISAVLRHHGMRDVLVNMGEVAALGTRVDGTPWQAGIADPSGQIHQRISLTDRALATSAPLGMTLFNHSHILHPNGQPATHSLASVSAPSAAVADGLSTALCLVAPEQAQTLVSQFPGARIEVLA